MAFKYQYDPAEHREKHCGAQNEAVFQLQGSAWIGQCPVTLDKKTAETLLQDGVPLHFSECDACGAELTNGEQSRANVEAMKKIELKA